MESILNDSYSAFLDEQEQIEMESAKLERDKFIEASFDPAIYPKFEDWLEWMHTNFYKPTENIPTSSLNVNGKVVRDSFESYLEQTKFKINDDGSFEGYLQSSHLKAAAISPRHLFFKIHDDIVPKPDKGKHFDLGEALHACILEPTRFSRFVTTPKVNSASHDGVDQLIVYWEAQLERVFIMDNADAQVGIQIAKEAKEVIVSEGGFLRKSVIEKIIQEVCDSIEKEKKYIKENYNLDNLKKPLQAYLHKMEALGWKAPWLDKIIKDLGLKRTETMTQKGKKEEVFNPEPLKELFTTYADAAAASKQEMKGCGDVLFTSLEQKKNYIEAIKNAIKLEEVDEQQMAIIKAIKHAYEVYGGGIIPRLVKHSKRENSIYCNDYDGLPLKVRPDAMVFEENVGVNAIISVKSTSAQDISKFFYDTAKFRYEVSEGMYQEIASKVTGREFRVTFTIMFQTVEPYGVALFWWIPEDLALGTAKFKDSIQVAKEALNNQKYPGYDMYAEEGHFGVIPMKLPWWSYKSLEPGDIDN